MPNTGKVAEIFNATILPHEGRQIYIGDHSLSVLRFSTYNLWDVAVLVPSDTDMQTSFMCRCVSRWLLRDTGTDLKDNATLDEPTILLAAPEDQLDDIEAELSSRGASVHLIGMGSDAVSAIIIATIRAMMMNLDLNNPTFRTDLSGETERLADADIFNSGAGGDMRDVLLLSSWVCSRLTRIIGTPDALNLLSFGSLTPVETSALVDGWVDELFGQASSCSGLNIMPMSIMFGDLMRIAPSGSIQDGLGSATLLSVGGDTFAGCGLSSSPLEVSSRPRLLESIDDPVPVIGTDGVRVPLSEVIPIDLDIADGAVVRVSEGADIIILEISSTSMNGSRSGEDPVVGFYNETVSEWQYTDTDGTPQSVPILAEPYYCPDLNSASVTILRVLRSIPASSAPQPAIREIKLILRFDGAVEGGFEVKIRQQSFAGELGQTSDMKWPTGSTENEYGESVERVNFIEWQPSPSSSYAIYRIETFNHTLWDVDPSDSTNENELTESYGAARPLLRSFQAWREMSG